MGLDETSVIMLNYFFYLLNTTIFTLFSNFIIF